MLRERRRVGYVVSLRAAALPIELLYVNLFLPLLLLLLYFFYAGTRFLRLERYFVDGSSLGVSLAPNAPAARGRVRSGSMPRAVVSGG